MSRVTSWPPGSRRRSLTSSAAANEQWEVSSEPLYGDAIESLDYWVAAMYLRDRVEYPVAGALPAPGGAGVLPEAPRAKPDDVVVDDVSVSGVVQRMGDYTAWRVVSENVVVTVTKRNASSPAPRIAAIRDLAPYVQRRAAGMTAWTKPYRDRPPSKLLTGPNATQPLWAHESFVAMVMTRSEELDHATALHRTPPVTDPDWLRRREAAIRRQQELRRQDHSTARAAVSRMVEEIMDLQQASWWSDEHRRKQAITRIIRETHMGPTEGPRSTSVTRCGAPGLACWSRSLPPRVSRATANATREHRCGDEACSPGSGSSRGLRQWL